MLLLISQPGTKVLGPYTVGEIPETVELQFVKADGSTVLADLDGFTVNFVHRLRGAAQDTAATVVGSIADGPTAKVTWAWPTLVEGTHFADVIVGNGSSRPFSQRLKYVVRRATSDTTPAI